MRVLGIVASAVATVMAAGIVADVVTAQSPAPSASPGASASPPPSASPTRPGPTQELLGFTVPGTTGRDRLVLLRTVLEPGDRLGGVGWGGSSVSWVESGTVLVLVEAGTIRVGGPGEAGGLVADGDSWSVETSDTVLGGPATRMTWTNEDPSRATVLTAAFVPEIGGDDVSLPGQSTAPTPTPGPKEAPPVVRTIVVRGTGPAGQPSTYTIRDQSGWVVGARVPDARELRDWPPLRRPNVGPARATGRDTFDLLVGWSGTGCGPTITLTVAPRLRSMRLVDRSPGCDASAMGHWLVLRLRTTVGLPMREIPLEWVRRRE